MAVSASKLAMPALGIGGKKYRPVPAVAGCFTPADSLNRAVTLVKHLTDLPVFFLIPERLIGVLEIRSCIVSGDHPFRWQPHLKSRIKQQPAIVTSWEA